ncbi:zinc finger protein-like 1 isoform X1 [Heterodontus francisci]|uniref:zinc finger protein-like 1 isoform X1 n=1 Tax=Heterodontus francisci TaxID=7792 RepID=UPI00355BEC81
MGLCKCPKRRVTTLFCYEHRVNVCEHCLISRHYKCVVMSYLQWLQDSDYNSNCCLCNTPLTDEDTIRLVCYDIFHWSCLNKMAAQLPKNTAPAGYQCPICKGPVFPPANTVSPVASVLKEKLSTVNWARAGLGLPLIEERPSQDQESLDTTDYTDWSNLPGSALASSPRKIYDTIARDTGKPSATQIDFDDDKYRRRPALSWFARWFKNTSGSRKQPLSRFQRFAVILLIGVLGFLTLVVVMSKLGRASVENDPNWDVLQNPHVQVGAE